MRGIISLAIQAEIQKDMNINRMFIGWIIYQTLESRLIGKTGFYQSGGAYGFRDQLQDTLALKYINPEILKKQIIKHISSYQD